MSDPVSDIEIEDVLSSIRRLVGDDHRVMPRPNPVEIPEKPAKLVLTPSLLVPVADSAPVMEDIVPELEVVTEEDAIAQTEQFAAENATTEPQTDIRDAAEKIESEPEVEDTDDPEVEPPQDSMLDLADFEQDGPSDQGAATAPWSDPGATLFDAADFAVGADVIKFEDAATPESVDFATEDIDDAPWPESPEQPEDQADDVFDEPVDDAPDEDIEFRHTYDGADADLADETAETANETISDPASDADQLNEPEPQNDASQADEPQTTDAEDDIPYSAATLSAKIAVLEAKIGQTQDQWEPDGELGDDYAGTQGATIAWQDIESDHAEPPRDQDRKADITPDAEDEKPEPAPANDEADEKDALDILDSVDAILDEDSLRELVADIVRQELQGALGERITRNVRKLVRREIHRALTAQELD